MITQKAYYVATAADKIYCNPKGDLEWKGFASQMLYLKGTLQKLEIEPQIFYAGKFKSATEPLREDRMTDANRLQLTELLGDFYNRLLWTTAQARNLDTSTLRKCVNQSLIRRAQDAYDYKLIDGLRYDDEVKDEIRSKLNIDKHAYLNFVTLGKYAKAVSYKQTGKDKITLIYAEGEAGGRKRRSGRDRLGDLSLADPQGTLRQGRQSHRAPDQFRRRQLAGQREYLA
ncbi:S49 family peptidase [Puia sp. P3]|uniref:S49 family peptidase n=1 Tax=Puia sp. P3 TaxID=3423952 RepID=UPI003D6717D6